MTHIVLGITIISSLALINYRVKGGRNSLVFTIPFLILFVFAAIRYDYGNDYWSYFDAFNSVKYGVSISETEKLYEFLLSLFPNFYLFIMFASLTTIYPVHKLVQNHVHKRYVFFSLFVYCVNPYMFLISLSAIRQFLAVSMFVLAVYLAYKRNIVGYVVLVILAAMLHNSAILLLPAYFVVNDKAINKKMIVYVVIGVLFFLFSGELFNQLMADFLEWFDKKEYLYYFTQGIKSSLRSAILSFCIFLYVVLNLTKLRGFRLVSAKLFLIGTILSIWSYHLNMMGRMQYYFDVFSVVAIPAIIQANVEEKKTTILGIINKYCAPILVCLIYLGRYYNFFADDLWESFTEYKTIFEVLW